MSRTLLVCFALALCARSAAAQPSDLAPETGLAAAPSDAGVAAAPSDAGAAAVPRAAAPAPLAEPPAEARPQIDQDLDPDDGLVTGDVVTLSLEITAREDDEVSIVSLDEARGAPVDDSLGQLDVPVMLLDKSRGAETPARGRVRRSFEIRYLLLAPGEHALPGLAVRVLTADGELGFVPIDAPAVTVGAVLGNEPNAEPKPATEPVQVMEDDPRPFYALAALAAMLLGALLFYFGARWWKRRALRPLPPPPPRAPWVLALERLDTLRLGRAEQLERGESVEWADGLSDALREYLGARFGFEGLESTTDEILDHLRTTRLGPDLSVHEVASLLQNTDLVKFAKAPFDDEASKALLSSAYRIVRATAPSEPLKAPVAQEAK